MKKKSSKGSKTFQNLMDFVKDSNPKFYQREKMILEVVESISLAMILSKMNYTKLARKLKMTKKEFSDIMQGDANMSIATFSDILFGLGYEFKITINKRD